MNQIIQEGSAKIYVSEKVFYNPLAKFSRSIGVIILSNESQEKRRNLVVADSLAATGVRGLRYFLESKSVDKIVFNDVSVYAYNIIKKNLSLNRCDNYEIYNFDASLFLKLNKNLYDMIDIDPFGSPSPYIDSAIESVKNNGLIAVTATDLTALCGVYPKSGFRKYAAVIKKTSFCHEIALRVLIKNVVEAAGRHFKIAYPIISHFSEQYARVYLRVWRGKQGYPYNEIGYLLLDDDIQIVSSMKFGGSLNGTVIGPLWIGPLHDVKFVKKILDNNLHQHVNDVSDQKRAEKLFKIFIEEAYMPPYYFDIHKICKAIKISPPPLEKIIAYLSSLGYKASRTHFSGYSLKTDSPFNILLDALADLKR